MQEAFRRDRERQASRERQQNLAPGMEGPIQVGRAPAASSAAVQKVEGGSTKILDKSSASDKHRSGIDRNKSPPVANRGNVDLTKNSRPDSREDGTLLSRLSSAQRSDSVLDSTSSASLPVRASPTPPSVTTASRPTSVKDLFKNPDMRLKNNSSEIISKVGITANPSPPVTVNVTTPSVTSSKPMSTKGVFKNADSRSKSKSVEILSKLGISTNAAPTPSREITSTAERRSSASSSALLNVINSPRSRRERRQLSELLRTLPHPAGPSRRPRLNPPLSPSILRNIALHEEGDAKLPTLDLSVEEATSGVTSLSTTAREEESCEQLGEETERSATSLVSPVAKKRKTVPMEEEKEDGSLQSEEPMSEEVSRMQLALQLSVQQQEVHRKMELLNTDISEQYRQLEALQRKIEGMEHELNKVTYKAYSVAKMYFANVKNCVCFSASS